MKKMMLLIPVVSIFLFLNTPLAAEVNDQEWHGYWRWRLGVDEPFESVSYGEGNKFFNPLYLYNKTRFWQGEKYNLGFVLRKGRNEPSITWDNAGKYYLIKYYFQMQKVLVDKIIIGTYQLQYNQGLVFYYPFSEINRPVKIEAGGIDKDTGTNPNAYFSGIAAEHKYKDFDLAAFYSHKLLDASLNKDGTVKSDLVTIRDDYGYIQSPADLKKRNTLRSEMIGGRVAYNFLPKTHFGLIAYRNRYTPRINPPASKGEYLFRGDKNTVYGWDFATTINKVELVSEFAQSEGHGQGWLIQPMLHLNKLRLWSAAYKYDRDYYNEYSSALTTDELDEDINEEGMKVGLEYKYKKWRFQTHFDRARHPDKGDNLGPTRVEVLWFETYYRPVKGVELYFRQWNKWYDEKTKLSGTGIYKDLYQSWRKTRLEGIWEPNEQFRFKTRYEYRVDTIYELKQVNNGFLVFEDIRYTVTKGLTIQGRFIYFEAPEVYLSELEPIWKNTYVSYYWNTRGTGLRYYLMADQQISRHSHLWLKYENTRKTSSNSPTDALKLQYDWAW
ncbi:MAG: hypothetical protein V1653_05055 [bacterium]